MLMVLCTLCIPILIRQNLHLIYTQYIIQYMRFPWASSLTRFDTPSTAPLKHTYLNVYDTQW